MNRPSTQNIILQQLRWFLVLVLLLGTTTSQAASQIYKSYFSDLAVSGYDTVAFFTDNKAIKGNSKFSTEYKDATWLFVSQENLNSFKSDPENYAPQYGGYCAWAVAHHNQAKGDPELWTVHQGKLYLNYDEDILNRWQMDKDALIVKADQNWPGLL